MPEVNLGEAAGRKKRVQILKKLIILSLFISILIPFILCLVLFSRVNGLNRALSDLETRLEALSRTAEEQQNLLKELLREKEEKPTENVSENTSANETPDDVLTVGVAVASPEDEGKHKVYLTFDDGPSIYTEDILEILDRYQVKATFFVVGREDEASKEALSMIVDGGHTLGMHSYSHKYSEIYDSEEAFAEDFVKIREYLYEVTGVQSTIYRFPGGSSNTVSSVPMQEFAEYLDSQGVRFFDWNVSSGDGGSLEMSPETLAENCLKGVGEREESVILLHDSALKGTTLEALPLIIENILAMEDTVILPITDDTKPVHHLKTQTDE